MKRVIVLQGVSGSGKTHYAKKLISDSKNPLLVSADNYLGHKFDPTKLGEAHALCFRIFVDELVHGGEDWEEHDLIIVDNTNTDACELAPYMLAASAFGVRAIIVRVDCDLEIASKRTRHNVPTNAISRQATRIRESNEVIARRGWELQFVNGEK